jgi:deoxyribodipyrimidine photo-lyase
MNLKRVRYYSKENYKAIKGPILYWMSRDQRVEDHWGLIFAQNLAIKNQQALCVVFSLVPDFLDATLRQYDFMIKGLEEVQTRLKEINIPFYILMGSADKTLPDFISEHHVGALVFDFNPLKIHKGWVQRLQETLEVPMYQVDSHNIVPCFYASDKSEYAAYTLRPKINRLLDEFMDDFASLKVHPFAWHEQEPSIDFTERISHLKVDTKVLPIDGFIPGQKAALDMLYDFIENRLDFYNEKRNDPLNMVLSNLSPYLHFGHISAQRIALEVSKSDKDQASKKSFLEELIIRKELADNFCYYNANYDTSESFSNWAKVSLEEHLQDQRPYLYDLESFEAYQTHDDLWNACQKDLVVSGKLHSYLRMYWAKKILEWTSSPDEALKIAIYLNDKYSLDGRDPNGYAGIAWSIGGVHDRAWFNRPIFGKVRYMNDNGCKKKFDVQAYIEKHLS